MRSLAPCLLVAVACAAGCGKKDDAPQTPATQPPATAAVTTTTTTTLPPPAWRTARWGMSKDALLAAFPAEAQRLGQAAPFGPGITGTTDMAIPSWDGNGAQFRVLFGFDSDALTAIHLTAIKPTDATCGDVEKALTDAFGAPAARNRTGTSLRGEEIVWKRAEHTVTLGCSGIHALGFRSVALSYTPPA